jgi:branched-subunit amino acid ABC-type transport system permease component
MGPILIGALVSGSIYALISLGFALAFRVSSVFNLTYGISLVAAGYLNYWLNSQQGCSLWFSIPAALLAVGAFGYLTEAVLIPVGKAAGLKTVDLLVLSWLSLVIIQDLIALIFESQSIYAGTTQIGAGVEFLGGRITILQMVMVGISVFAGLSLVAIVRWLAVGKQITAVGDDQRLAQICGLNVGMLVAANGIAAALLTGSAGILLSYQQQLDPTQGFRYSIIGIVSTLIGNPLGPGGSVLGAYTLALFETFVLYAVDPQLRDTAVYIVLFVVVAITYRKSRVPLIN